MSIWDYQRLLLQRLIQWSLFSLGVGAVLLRGRRFWHALGRQFIGWSAVNLGIAYVRNQVAEQRYDALPDPYAPSVLATEERGLRRLLFANVVLDLVYLAVGRWMVRRRARGASWGILLQGVFLFLFDLYHAAGLRDEQ